MLAALIVLLGLSGIGTIKLFHHIDTNLFILLPDNYPVVQALHEIKAKARNFGGLQIIFEAKDPAVVTAALPKIAARLEEEPMIRRVYWKRPGYDFFREKKMLFLSVDELTDLKERIDERIQHEKLQPFIVSLDDSADGQSATLPGQSEETLEDLITRYQKKYPHGTGSPYMNNEAKTLYMVEIDPNGDSGSLNFDQALLKRITKILQTDPLFQSLPETKFYTTGGIRNRVEEVHALHHDLVNASLVCIIVMPLLLILYYRSIASLLYIISPTILGLTMTLATTQIIFGELNLITSFLFSILTGLGVDFAIQIVSRYLDERRNGRSHEEALLLGLSATGLGIRGAAGTTLIGFITLTLTDFKGFSQFGWISSIGLIMICIASYLVLPPLLSVTEQKRRFQQPTPNNRFPQLNNWLHKMPARSILIASCLLTIVSISFFPRVGFEYDFNKVKYRLPAFEEARAKLAEINSGRNVPAVVLLRGADEAKALEAAVKERAKNPARENHSSIDHFTSRYQFVPEDQEKKRTILAQIRTIVSGKNIEKMLPAKRRPDLNEFKRSLSVTPFTMKDVPADATDPFIGNPKIPGEFSFISAPADMELADGRNAMRFANDLKDFAAGGKIYHPTNDSVILGEVLQTMLHDSKTALALTIIGILLFVIIDFRRWSRIIWVTLPLGLGMIWMLGIMGALHLRFNFFNIIVIPLILGLGINLAIYLVRRYDEMGVGSMPTAIGTTGVAGSMSLATVIAGFGGLIVAHHPGLQSLGGLTCIGIITCLIASLTTLPAVILLGERMRSKKL